MGFATLTPTYPYLEGINRFYGTRLTPDDLWIYGVPSAIRRLFALDPDPHSLQPLACLMRFGRCIRRRYDAVLSFCDEIELGEPIIQYMHYPYMVPRYKALCSMKELPLSQRWKQLWKFSCHPWRMISGFNYERMRANMTLVNSDWTGRVVQAGYGTPTTTIYPPVTGHTAQGEWLSRENGFVGIGRLSGEKRWEQVIKILRAVRERGYAIHLHLIGTASVNSRDDSYYRAIKQLIAENSSWITFKENLTRMDLLRVIARHRYGIHATVDEHFGMAVAEMTVGGCIVFVPNSGGQTEIVAQEPRLLYDSIDDAVEKIARVLDDAEAQRELQAMLLARAYTFSEDRFMRQIREMVALYIHATRYG